MITLIIKSYFFILLSVGMGSIFIFIIGLYFILKFYSKNPTPINDNSKISNDLSAIAGEDLLATQLDLARAYIETGKKASAKKILEQVATKGNAAHQEEVRILLSTAMQD